MSRLFIALSLSLCFTHAVAAADLEPDHRRILVAHQVEQQPLDTDQHQEHAEDGAVEEPLAEQQRQHDERREAGHRRVELRRVDGVVVEGDVGRTAARKAQTEPRVARQAETATVQQAADPRDAR